MQEIKKNIYWCGIRDWGLGVFHGHELSTHRGSSYNSYLIKDKKTVLIDTVWDPYKEKFVEDLEKNVGLKNIDAIVINHVEPDHGGSLGLLMDRIPETPIYCTKNGAEIIKKYFGKDWNFNIVKTGDYLELGEYKLNFVEMQMLHWPDSLLEYVDGARLVISNDAFGQHYCGTSLFNDETDECELYQEAIKYFANILGPFKPLITRKIEQISAMNLDIDMIAPSHGVIWRKNPAQILERYLEWSDLSYNEGYAVIIYDTMYNSTKDMAEAIAGGLEEEGMKFKIFNAATKDRSDLNVEIFKANAVILGSCTVNNSVLRPTASLLDEIKGLKVKNKLAFGFGSYGWSGEAHKIISQKLEESGLTICAEPFGVKYKPTSEEIEKCIEIGKNIAKQLKG
ncbi:flavorubredoxin [Ruminiclostridium sufflavum DSM 19573]|uniref:Flavorubredoxin n=1 Tax=Ruminiclostridium sufflavum DSM 19573 TaxID=1121337 RepID=A0A318XQ58_9FIRM|nr:flavodoxin domain-containing protein [Ruminiclostridium sufflavum]PYG89408.1 flavorubredoxin [Ruminiclostridium sufflavum DSM 19573]